MKDKILIGIILLLFLTLFIETAYLLKIKSENGLPVRAFHAAPGEPRLWRGMPQQSQNNLNFFKRRNHRSLQDPFSDFKNIEKLLGAETLHGTSLLGFGPTFNRFENEKDYIIRGHVPNLQGMINVTIENDALIISGEQKTKSEEKHGGFYKMQSSFNSFNKMVPLPENIKISGIKTEYKDGDLVITIPKNGQSSNLEKVKI